MTPSFFNFSRGKGKGKGKEKGNLTPEELRQDQFETLQIQFETLIDTIQIEGVAKLLSGPLIN
jgi:hypothetical protein